MNLRLVDHHENPDFWRHEPPKIGPCWVCHQPTEWIYLDLGYQHLDCDSWPNEDGTATLIIRGGLQITLQGSELEARIELSPQTVSKQPEQPL